MYYDQEGNELTKDEITVAVRERRAVLRWSHAQWRNVAALMIYPTAEEAKIESEKDTRGQCYSVWDEIWSRLADDADEALRAAEGELSYA